jgi:hypothetical protein
VEKQNGVEIVFNIFVYFIAFQSKSWFSLRQSGIGIFHEGDEAGGEGGALAEVYVQVTREQGAFGVAAGCAGGVFSRGT